MTDLNRLGQSAAQRLSQHRLASRIAMLGGISLTAALGTAFSQSASAHELDPPRVPPTLVVETGNKVAFIGHGVGTQNYVCLPSGTGFAYALFTPQATLFDRADREIITHFFSPNPDEQGAIRATWQNSRDASTVWAQAFVPPSFDPNFVARNSVPWLVLKVVGKKEGPRGGDALTDTTFIQRINTQGGVAPATGCASPADVGNKQFVQYTADYVFFVADYDNRH
jgi:hypothetical protein